jgi:VanZ family protein
VVHTRVFLRIWAWLLATAILLLSIVPPALRPVIAARNVEHYSIFFILGFTAGLAYDGSYWIRSAVLVTFIATVETAQLCVSGRHARLEDFAVNVVGCLLGVGIAGIARCLLNRIARKPPGGGLD